MSLQQPSPTSPAAIEPFRAHPLLRSGHLQTVWGGLVPGKLAPYSAAPLVVELPDGEALVVHEERTGARADDSPIVILVHGLGGDHSSPYLRRIAYRLSAANMRAWRVDMRGCGAGLEHGFRPSHAGASSDLTAVVSAAQQRYPRARMAIAAFSLGGNILLKMLGELADQPGQNLVDLSRIELAVAVAPPADLHVCSLNMERMTRLPYTRYYLKLLEKQVNARAARWEAWRAIAPKRGLRTIRQFDDWYTAPLAGFANSDEYYTLASSSRWFDKITVPTRLLIDQHDPIIPYEAFRQRTFSPCVTIETTRFGGHLGYLARDSRGGVRRWLDDWTEHVLRRAFED